MSGESTAQAFFNDPERAARYAEGPARIIPGFATLHRMILQLLGERVGDTARVLVLGAGGGLELLSFAESRAGWRFVGVDPSRAMLDQAERVLGELGSRVELVEGYIPDTPPGPFDAATCLMTLQFLPDDGQKLEALRAIHARLAPGAPFVVVDNCIDLNAPDADERLDRYIRFGAHGSDAEQLAKSRTMVRSSLGLVGPAREEALLAEAGFTGTELFFAGLSFRGWIAYA